ncbi:MAG: DUF4230 domain-containing protein [Bryobacteraceae bacterium]|nr:DUF4230 domain-containing protein [Bryobacteraceae bacterium]
MKRRTVIGVFLLVACISYWLGSRQWSNPFGDTNAVVVQIRQLNQLVTVRYTVEKVVAIEEPRPLLTAEKLLLVLQARIEAGVDLSQLKPGDVERRSDGTVAIRIPAAQILNAAIEEKQTRVWDRQKSWWTPWIPFDPMMEQRARIIGLDAAKAAAIEGGILRQADASAEASIRSLLGLAGVTKVVVIKWTS